MTDRVVDASALVRRLLPTPARTTAQRLAASTFWHAPHLIDAECGHALRRAVLRGEITAQEGRVALRTASAVVDRRHEHRQLATIAWSLRNQLTYYDALYVALAVGLDLPLVTADRRLAKAPGLPCAVELDP